MVKMHNANVAAGRLLLPEFLETPPANQEDGKKCSTLR